MEPERTDEAEQRFLNERNGKFVLSFSFCFLFVFSLFNVFFLFFLEMELERTGEVERTVPERTKRYVHSSYFFLLFSFVFLFEERN